MTGTRDLVLLHGALGDSAQLEPLADALRPAFRVHLLDFEGHAAAPAPDRPFRMRDFAGNVLALLDGAGIGRAHLFGYSMGGYVALRLASEHPARVDRVATYGTKFRWDPATAAGAAGFLDPAAIRAKAPQFADALEARHRAGAGWEAVLARTAEMVRDLGEHPFLDDTTLARIAHPVHVIVGDRDATVSVDESSGAAALLPAGRVTVLPGVTHPIERADPARLAPLLTEFFVNA